MAGRDIKFKVKLLDQSVQELELDASVSTIVRQWEQSNVVSVVSLLHPCKCDPVSSLHASYQPEHACTFKGIRMALVVARDVVSLQTSA